MPINNQHEQQNRNPRDDLQIVKSQNLDLIGSDSTWQMQEDEIMRHMHDSS